MSDFLNIFLSNLGGTTVGVLVLGFLFKTWISTRLTEGIKAEYGEVLETLKTRLANDAKIHEKRVQALEALHATLIELMPTRESEDQDWEDAMMVVGFDVDKHRATLRAFDKDFGVLLPEGVRSMLSEARDAANDANLPQSIKSNEDLNDDLVRKGTFARKMVEALMRAKHELEKDVFARTVAVK
jgi:hypothetical protein